MLSSVLRFHTLNAKAGWYGTKRMSQYGFTIHTKRLKEKIQMKKFVTILCAVALVAAVSCKKEETTTTETAVTETAATMATETMATDTMSTDTSATTSTDTAATGTAATTTT